MSAPSPSLSISDIMHPLSSSAVNTAAKSPLEYPKSSTPEPVEPLDLAEIEGMRKRLMSMGYGESSKGKKKVTSREQELADMLLKITHPAYLPQPSQLHAQAETIANLIYQRDFLVKRSAEERERWEAEREGWARVAQALLLRGRKEASQIRREDSSTPAHKSIAPEGSSQSFEEIGRINTVLHSEKKFFQQKLMESQNRLAALESELIQLKPFLLFHDLTQLHSSSSNMGLKPDVGPSTPRLRAIQWNEASDYEADSDGETPRLQPRPQFRNPILRPVGSEVVFSAFQQSPQKSKRRRDVLSPALLAVPTHTPKTPQKKTGLGHVQIITSKKPLLSDARTEHLLLAARKIGMQRATYLSGIYSRPYSPPELPTPRKRRRTASPSKPQKTPKTPRRMANISTPLLTRTPLDTSSAQPRTPLQSLLSVAQSVLSDPGKHSLAPQESPLAKRQKADHPSSLLREQGMQVNRKEKERHSGTDALQFKSALDFLADQAEAYGSKSGSRERDEQSAPTHDDFELEDATGSTDYEVNVDRHIFGQTTRDQTAQGTGPEHHRTEDVFETQKTSRGSFQGENQSFTEVFPSLSSRSPFGDKSSAQSKGFEGQSELADSNSLMLAPAIDLTPVASRSPGPQEVQRRSHHKSRSHSADEDHVSSSFSEFVFGREQIISPGTNGPNDQTTLSTFHDQPLQMLSPSNKSITEYDVGSPNVSEELSDIYTLPFFIPLII